MGKIFGIADLPISTIMTPFEPIVVPQDPALAEIEYAAKLAEKYRLSQDKYTPKEITKAKTPKILDMRNGFGKLMSHFFKKIVK